LANLVNEAALNAARRNQKVVTMFDLEFAKDKVMMGPERRSMVVSEKERRLTAIHEAGHALVGMNIPESDPVHKVTIVPRGRALGVTYYLPEQDVLGRTKEELLAMIANAMGGRIAEELTSDALRRAPRTTSSGRPNWRVRWSALTECQSWDRSRSVKKKSKFSSVVKLRSIVISAKIRRLKLTKK
jgi:hypothetical protein